VSAAEAARRSVSDDPVAGPADACPGGVYIALVVAVPFLLAIGYSFSTVTVGTSAAHFVGLANFRNAVEDPTFLRALRNTFLFALASQALVMVLASILAIALQKDFRGKWVVRLLILLPWVAPISLGSIGWLWIFDPIYSVINWTSRDGAASWRLHRWLGQLISPCLHHHGRSGARCWPRDLLGGLS
jgi:multiple sugar transport system permease protein